MNGEITAWCVRALAAALALTATGALAVDLKEERQSRAYQEAMADYTAGRLDAALAGFENVIKADGDNASARFQLACLLQDYKKEYLGAICQYREYIRLARNSDKAALAQERMALCEGSLARVLAEKYALVGGAAQEKESARVRRKLDETDKRLAEAAKALEEAERRMTNLERENARLRSMVSRMSREDDEAQDAAPKGAKSLASAHELLEGDEDDAPPEIDAPAPDETDEAPIGRSLEDAKALLEDDDDGGTASTLLDPATPPAAQKLTDLGKKDEAPRADFGRPETYVVQEGDTLYKIALKFYGKTSAWEAIRKANKAKITTDGRVKSGETIVLP